MRQLLPAVLLISGHAMACFADAPTAPELAQMVTTSGQEGMQQVDEILRRESNEKENRITNRHLGRIYEASGQSGASNVFIVDATNLHDAIKASAGVYAGSRSADTPAAVNQLGPVRGSYWLVAFLGKSHSSPLRWIVDSAAVTGSRVRLTYHKPQYNVATSDNVPYYYWIPLGKLDPGIYEVELFDADQKAVTLMRRVDVTHGAN